jgi:branched-chain amino acid transport system substrate-binding protein
MRFQGLLEEPPMHIVASVILALTLVTGLGAGPAPAQEAIQIGATAALTGPVSSLGATQGKLWEGWEHAQNEAGGIMVRSLGKKLPIKIIYYDDKSDPKVSVKFYEKLINDDKVQFLIGPMGSPIGFASTTVAERYKFPMLLGPSSDPKIFERGFKYIQGVQDLATEWSRHYFDMHGKLGKAKTMAILAEDILFSRGVADGSKRFAAAVGMKTVFDEVAPKDIEDFTPIVARMKAAGADLAYISSYPPFFIKFAKQAAELGYRPAALHCPLCSAASVRQNLGPLAELVTGEIFWVPGMRLGDYRMLEATLKHSGVDPLQWSFAVSSLIQLEVLRAGIEKTGTLDREAVFQAIKGMDVETIGGAWKAQPNGAGTITPFPVQIQGGQMPAVWPPKAKTGDYVYPRQR